MAQLGVACVQRAQEIVVVLEAILEPGRKLHLPCIACHASSGLDHDDILQDIVEPAFVVEAAVFVYQSKEVQRVFFNEMTALYAFPLYLLSCLLAHACEKDDSS